MDTEVQESVATFKRGILSGGILDAINPAAEGLFFVKRNVDRLTLEERVEFQSALLKLVMTLTPIVKRIVG